MTELNRLRTRRSRSLTALSGVIGRSVGIRPKRRDDWLVVPNLWGYLTSRPGLQKSPAVAEATKPLRRLAHAAQEEFETNSADAKAKVEILKLQLEAAKQDARDAVKSGQGIELAQDRISQVQRRSIGKQICNRVPVRE